MSAEPFDYVKRFLEENDIPITREWYISLNWPGVDPKQPLPAELEAELPNFKRYEDLTEGQKTVVSAFVEWLHQ